MSRNMGIGIDIGGHSVRVAAVKKLADGQIGLTHYGQAATPSGALEDGLITNPSQLAEALKEASRTAGIKGGKVTTSLHGQGALIRHLRLPDMPEEELAEAVRWEAEGQLPFPVADAVMDFASLGPAEDESGEVEVLLAAAPRKLVHQVLEVVELAGFRPTAVDCAAFALLRSAVALRNPVEGPEGPVLLLDFGGSKLALVIVRGERIRFTRMTALGGDLATERIAADIGVAFAEAEQVKLGYGSLDMVVGDDEAQEFAGDDLETIVNRQVAHQALQDIYGDLLDEIRRSLDYYRVLTGWQESVAGIVVSGGSAKIPGLVAALNRDLGLPVELLRPETQLVSKLAKKREAALGNVDPAAAICLGLALRDVMGV